jgi:hypothetical protein
LAAIRKLRSKLPVPLVAAGVTHEGLDVTDHGQKSGVSMPTCIVAPPAAASIAAGVTVMSHVAAG